MGENGTDNLKERRLQYGKVGKGCGWQSTGWPAAQGLFPPKGPVSPGGHVRPSPSSESVLEAPESAPWNSAVTVAVRAQHVPARWGRKSGFCSVCASLLGALRVLLRATALAWSWSTAAGFWLQLLPSASTKFSNNPLLF